jgi:hypothetical protein
MPRWTVRIRGTINDEVEVEDAASEEEAKEIALRDWRYVEFEDLEADDAEKVSE